MRNRGPAGQHSRRRAGDRAPDVWIRRADRVPGLIAVSADNCCGIHGKRLVGQRQIIREIRVAQDRFGLDLFVVDLLAERLQRLTSTGDRHW
jgi:hypothetical protein